ncbi:TonB-dependent receptor [Flavobacterium davisii]|uniref:TonB-dependent receptor n=1 Tax=Flavobacterium davisii TaxID=2906077 RepID=A0ABW8PNJ6_9FLAO
MKFKFSLLFLFFTMITFAQKATITGTISDKDLNNEALPFANIVLKGSATGTTTDLQGKYKLSVPSGIHILVFSFLGYETKEVKITIHAGETKEINETLGSGSVTMEDVVVKATVSREKETALLLEQKNAVEMKQVIGAQEMSRKGISDAQAAITKISGISKQEGVKNVFVRGLGDRYNSTSLNGFPIPSEDPEYKNISLDFFGTDIIKNISVNKVFNSSKISDVGGANIDISSKELNTSSVFSLDLSTGSNTRVLGTDFKQQTGVDYWGISNTINPGLTNQKYNFPNKLTPITNQSPYNHSFGLTVGKKIRFGENSFTAFLVGSHSTDFNYTKQFLKNTTTTGVIFRDQVGDKFSRSINQLGLLNLSLKLNKYRFDYNGMIIHNNNQYYSKFYGVDNDKFQGGIDDKGLMIRQQNNDNLLIVNQLLTQFQLGKNTNFNAGLSYNITSGKEPDRKVNNLTQRTETDFVFTGGDGRQTRTFLNLDETDLNTKLEISHRLNSKDTDDKSSVLKLGYNGRQVDDKFSATLYNFRAISGLYDENVNLDIVYGKQNFIDGKSTFDTNRDQYSAQKNIHSGYADLTYLITPKLTVNMGASIDYVNLAVQYNVNEGGTTGKSTIKNTFVLPNASLKWDASEKNSFRLASSKTYTLPQAKEISPYIYIDVNFNSQGNKDLKYSENYNLDAKWDFYISKSELFSLTGFYKHIQNPIARVEEGGSGGYLTYKNISNVAKVLGAEIEVRKNILETELHHYDTKLALGFNASYIYSKLTLDVLNTPKKETQLEGSSPFLVNFDLSSTFSKEEKSFTNTLVLNYFSDRIYTIGTLTYEDIIEKGVLGLDFISTSKINKHLAIKIKARNLLDPTYSLSRRGINGGENVVLKSFQKGINFSLGLTYDF